MSNLINGEHFPWADPGADPGTLKSRWGAD